MSTCARNEPESLQHSPHSLDDVHDSPTHPIEEVASLALELHTPRSTLCSKCRFDISTIEHFLLHPKQRLMTTQRCATEDSR